MRSGALCLHELQFNNFNLYVGLKLFLFGCKVLLPYDHYLS